MAVLRKIKASTLMETLVGTVLIVVIFMMASMLLNTLFAGSLKYNAHLVGEHLHELQYQYRHKLLQTPYEEQLDSWNISVFVAQQGNSELVVFEAVNSTNKKTVTKQLVYEMSVNKFNSLHTNRNN